MAERSNAAVLKTVEVQASGGSNPSLSAGVRRKMLFYNILRLVYLVGNARKNAIIVKFIIPFCFSNALVTYLK